MKNREKKWRSEIHCIWMMVSITCTICPPFVKAILSANVKTFIHFMLAICNVTHTQFLRSNASCKVQILDFWLWKRLTKLQLIVSACSKTLFITIENQLKLTKVDGFSPDFLLGSTHCHPVLAGFYQILFVWSWQIN